MATPIGFAHRGARALERDNTLRSFARALDMGASALESDVWITADGVPVLDHDGYVRARRKKVRIREVDSAEMPSHIPSLADLFAVCGTEFSLSLDIKDPDAAASVVDVTREAGGDDTVRRLWMCHPEWQTVLGWREYSKVVRLVDSTRLRKIGEGFEARVGQLAQVGIDAINMHHRDWESSHVITAHAQGLYTMAWDLQRPADLDRLLAMEIDAVFSDYVDRMTSAINRRVDVTKQEGRQDVDSSS